MERNRILAIGIFAAALMVAAYLILTLPGGQAPAGFIAHYSDVACNQTALACAQEKLRDGSFDCTSLCEGVCSPEMMGKCVYGDFS